MNYSRGGMVDVQSMSRTHLRKGKQIRPIPLW